MFNRFASYKKAIQDRSIDFNTLSIMIDFHLAKGTLIQAEYDELYNLMYPEVQIV